MMLDRKILAFHNLRYLKDLVKSWGPNLLSISLEFFRQLFSLRSFQIRRPNRLSRYVLQVIIHEDNAAANCLTLPFLKQIHIDSCGIAGEVAISNAAACADPRKLDFRKLSADKTAIDSLSHRRA